MPVLLRTFGGLWLIGSDLPAACSQRRRLALLALLARGPEGRVSRDRLQLLLWPESDAGRARHGLDQLLYATRRDLGRTVIATAGDGTLRLDPAAVSADCQEFERLVGAGDLEAAVALYAGPFLDAFHLGDAPEFERWVDEERARLAEAYANALESLAAAAESRGELARAAGWWRRRAAAGPLDARVAGRLVEVLVAQGDSAAALRHARADETLVREELGLAPDPRVLAAARRPAHQPPVPEPAAPAVLDPADPPAVGPETTAPPRTPRMRFALAAALLLAVVLGTVTTRFDRTGGAPLAAAEDAPAPRAGADRGTRDAEAESLYLRGRIAWNYRTRDGLEQAVVLFRRAIERDPRYPEAYAGLADAYVLLGYHGFLPGDASFPKGKAAALQALALDPRMGEAYAALGMALQWEKRWIEAERAFASALRYAPRYATAHQWYALLLTVLGRNEEAVVHGRHAAELDPLSVQVHNTYGAMLYHVGAFDSALHVYERIVTLEPDSAWVRQNPWVLDNFGMTSTALGRHQQAVRLLQQAAAAVPGHPRPLYHLALDHLARGDTAAARRAFAAADTAHAYYPLYRALLHANLGEVNAAFAWLGRVREWGLPALNGLVNARGLERLRADARYGALEARLGL